MNLFELFVKIGVDDQASGKLSNLSSKLGNGLKTAAKIGTAAMAAIGTATVAAGAAFANNIKQTAEYADNIDKMSQKMGLSAQAYQEWDFIMQHSGTSMEALKAGMKTLANAVENGNDAFERLGITQEEIASMNQEELFAKTLEGLQGVTDETERTYLAGQLLGRGATELGALLNTSAEDVEAMRQNVHDLGGVMSDEAVKAGAAFQDSLQNLGVATSSLGRNLSSQFLPSVTSMMDGLSALITGDESGFALIETGINDFIGNLSNQLPKFLEMGAKIVENLATAILDNIPVLFESGVSIITELLTSAIDMLPQIVALGLDLIVSLASGIAESLPELIPTIIEVMMQIVDTLTDPTTLSNLLNAAVAIIMALANSLLEPKTINRLLDAAIGVVNNLATFLMENLSPLLNAAINIIMALVNYILEPSNLGKLIQTAVEIVVVIAGALVGAAGEIVKAAGKLILELMKKFKETDWGSLGKNLVSGFKKGIQNAWWNLKTWFRNLFGDLIGIAKRILGIASPSKVFKKLGEFSAEGFGIGWADEFADVTNDIEDSLDFGGYDYEVVYDGNGDLGTMYGGSGGAGGVTVVQNIYSEAKTAADLMQEAIYQQERAVLLGV